MSLPARFFQRTYSQCHPAAKSVLAGIWWSIVGYRIGICWSSRRAVAMAMGGCYGSRQCPKSHFMMVLTTLTFTVLCTVCWDIVYHCVSHEYPRFTSWPIKVTFQHAVQVGTQLEHLTIPTWECCSQEQCDWRGAVYSIFQHIWDVPLLIWTHLWWWS